MPGKGDDLFAENTQNTPLYYSPSTFLARVGQGHSKRDGRICKSLIHKNINADIVKRSNKEATTVCAYILRKLAKHR
jgi:hypothetical protein